MRFVNPTKKNLKNIYTDSPPYSYKEFILYLVEITQLLTKYKLFFKIIILGNPRKALWYLIKIYLYKVNCFIF